MLTVRSVQFLAPSLSVLRKLGSYADVRNASRSYRTLIRKNCAAFDGDTKNGEVALVMFV
jgi:hypothetical protein